MKAIDYPVMEEKKNNLGRLNFFMINQTNFFIKDFLKVNILDNCIFVLMIDLDNHENIKENIEKWINFIEHELEAYLRQIPLKDRKEVLKHFDMMNKKMKDLEFKSILIKWQMIMKL